MTAPPPPATDALAPLARHGALWAFAKPSGLLVHNSAWAGGPRERTLLDLASGAVGAKVWPVHRLDRGTSGVWLCVDDVEALEPWRAALAAGAKDYLAVVRGRTLAPQSLLHPLTDTRGVARVARSTVAALALGPEERVSLAWARIFTGRFHQVRRHLARAHHPVAFDCEHGDGRFSRGLRARHGGPPLALHAWQVALRPPGDDTPLVLRCPPPWAAWAAGLIGQPAWDAAWQTLQASVPEDWPERVARRSLAAHLDEDDDARSARLQAPTAPPPRS
jgi:tRNA pseudouridine65 synthase